MKIIDLFRRVEKCRELSPEIDKQIQAHMEIANEISSLNSRRSKLNSEIEELKAWARTLPKY